MDPIISSLISMVVVFIVVLGMLWATKPAFVSKVDANGKKVVLTDKLLAYSSLAAVAVGLIVALGMNMMKEPVKTSMRSSFRRPSAYNMQYSCGC